MGVVRCHMYCVQVWRWLCWTALLVSCGKRSQPIQAARIASYEAASSETTSSVTPSGLSIKAAKPVDAYVVLGVKIKTFWFNVASPLLP